MKIETKYGIGYKIWIAYEPNIMPQNIPSGEVSVYDTYIKEILILKDEVRYITNESIELKEDEVILFHERVKLTEKIIDLLNNIHEREIKTN